MLNLKKKQVFVNDTLKKFLDNYCRQHNFLNNKDNYFI